MSAVIIDPNVRFRELFGEVVKRCLDAGHTIEVEGLGRFQSNRTTDGGPQYEFVPESAVRVFIAYAAEDLPVARRLCDALREHGCSPWLDKEQLLPGQNWPRAIEQAIDVADAFVACFSPRSVAKHGQFQCEIRYALDCARRRPLDDAFLIPVRIEECRVPRRIADQTQYVDLFKDWDRGVRLIAKTAKRASHHQLTALMK